ASSRSVPGPVHFRPGTRRAAPPSCAPAVPRAVWRGRGGQACPWRGGGGARGGGPPGGGGGVGWVRGRGGGGGGGRGWWRRPWRGGGGGGRRGGWGWAGGGGRPPAARAGRAAWCPCPGACRPRARSRQGP